MPDSLVPVDERMIQNEGEAERRSFGSKIWIEIRPTETLSRLSKRRFKSVDVSNSAGATPPFQYGSVKLQDLGDGEISDHASRRYSSAFFSITRCAAVRNASSGWLMKS